MVYVTIKTKHRTIEAIGVRRVPVQGEFIEDDDGEGHRVTDVLHISEGKTILLCEPAGLGKFH